MFRLLNPLGPIAPKGARLTLYSFVASHFAMPLLPEINTVRADMTRTSLVDGITPFCFTCDDNIRLVCGNAKRQKMRVNSTSVKRAHQLPPSRVLPRSA